MPNEPTRIRTVIVLPQEFICVRPDAHCRMSIEIYDNVLYHISVPSSTISYQTMPALVWWDVLIDTASNRFAARIAEGIAITL